MTKPSVVVFDLGGVLLDWDPRHLYRKLFDDPAEMEGFLAHVLTNDWLLEQDRGRPFREGVRILSEQYPQYADKIRAYDERWVEAVTGDIPASVQILRDLVAKGVPCYALTNFSAEKMPVSRARFDFYPLFKGVLVSGDEGLVKPDPAIYRLLLDRYHLAAEDCVFVDDTPVNVEAAQKLGFHAIRFTTPAALRTELADLGLL